MKKLLLIILLALIISCGKKDEKLEKAKKDAEIEQKVEEKLNEMNTEKKKEENSGQSNSKSKGSSDNYREKLITRTKSIDSQYDKITNNSDTAYDNIDELNSLGEKWDIELNKVYKLLISKLSENQKQELKIEQRKWIKNRDEEIENTGDNLVQADIFYNLTKERTLELASLYDKL